MIWYSLNKYLKRIKFNTGFILERLNLVVLILVPWEILKIFFLVSQMIWIQNSIEMKKNATVMVLEVLVMFQTFSLDLNSLLKYFLGWINFKHRTNFSPLAKD